MHVHTRSYRQDFGGDSHVTDYGNTKRSCSACMRSYVGAVKAEELRDVGLYIVKIRGEGPFFHKEKLSVLNHNKPVLKVMSAEGWPLKQ